MDRSEIDALIERFRGPSEISILDIEVENHNIFDDAIKCMKQKITGKCRGLECTIEVPTIGKARLRMRA